MTHTQTYDRLQVTALTPEQHEQTCGYWYTVTNGATAHTAFATKAGLMRWLDERALTIDGELPAERGTFATFPVTGAYRTVSHGDFLPGDEFGMVEDAEWRSLRPVVITNTLSNGRWTLALITEDGAGWMSGGIVRMVRTVHTLNPNVRTRLEAADPAAMRALMDGPEDTMDAQPMTADESGRYVCVAHGGCLHAPHITINSDGVWVRQAPGGPFSSAHRDCYERWARLGFAREPVRGDQS